MPELTVIHIGLLAASMLVGIVVGWIFRGNRSTGEKSAINAGWQEQLAAQRGEHERLLEQNKSLMEQNSQYQASNKDAKMRASELSGALKEAFERRDELQRQIKEIRGNLEVAINERDQLQSRASSEAKIEAAIKERDDKIIKLNRELENWQDRLPPLIERFRKRNEDAEHLEQELADARERIVALESMVGSEETRVEPVDADALGDDLDASNDPHDEAQDDLVAAEDLIGDEQPEAEDVDVSDSMIDTHSRDDLKLIKGVGPAIEKTLNEMGIFRFNQIAEMSEYDIDRIAHRLKGFRSRIYREDWMGQARDLQVQKASG